MPTPEPPDPPRPDARPPLAAPPPGPARPHRPHYTPAEKRALALFAAAAALAIAWLLHPLAIGIFLGMLMAFTMQPLHKRLRARWPGRVDWGAALCTAIATVVLLGLAAGFGALLTTRGASVARSLPTALTRDGPLAMASALTRRTLTRFHLPAPDLTARVNEALGSIATRATELAAFVAATLFESLLALFFLLLTLHFTLVRWNELARRAETVLPLHPNHTRALLEEFRNVGRTVLLGTVLTGVAQGTLAGIGFAITGVPEAALLGALTAVASLVPAVGTLALWVPAGVYLILTNHVGRGVVELVWGGLVVVGFSDYVLRPRLVRGEGEVPALATFVALFGGIEVFGIIGLVLGPVVMALALAVLKIYERESEGKHGRGAVEAALRDDDAEM